MEPILAAAIAALLTLFDLDSAFYVPARVKGKIILYSWWWGFVLANGALAAGLYYAAAELEPLKAMNSWLRAAAVGFGYLALIRLKFTTIPAEGGQDAVPVGIELFYNKAKDFVYKRINDIARAARVEEALELAGRSTLEELVYRAKANLQQDALLTADRKRSVREWVLQVFKDKSTSDSDKRLVLATFVLTGQRPSDAE